MSKSIYGYEPFGASLYGSVAAIVTTTLVLAFAEAGQSQPRKPAGSTLRIVKDDLLTNGNFYYVKGSIYNPNSDAVKNVVINYYIWKKWMGQDGHGSVIKETGGLASATIKYLPPKQTVEFTATSRNAPVMSRESGLSPDPISAEITADWDDQPWTPRHSSRVPCVYALGV